MSIKLIASDLDGTLMSPDHLTVSKRTYNTLKTAHERGIKLAHTTSTSTGATWTTRTWRSVWRF